jgi:hypothetical protein
MSEYLRGMRMRSIGPKLPDKVESMNRRTAARLRAERLAEVSKRVREESMRVNAEFAAIERDPDA